jgi:hypothetical protein
MPAITFQDFSGGLDRRLPITSQEANKLWALTNAYVTQGKRIRKRPGLLQVSTGLAGSVGLVSADGINVNVFHTKGSGYVAPSSVVAVGLDDPGFGAALSRIQYAELFDGFLYVVAYYAEVFRYQHHYVDAALSTLVTDVNCPHESSVTKAASRIFAVSQGPGTVRYSAAGDARDWTTASDAGFLPVGLQQDKSSALIAVGTFQDALAVLFEDGAQIWNLAVDPSLNAIRKRLYGLGTSCPASLAAFGNDLAYLSRYGFRSMTVTSQTDRIDDNDLGVAIDSLVEPEVALLAGNSAQSVVGLWVPKFGQYWCIFPPVGLATNVWVYTFGRSSKVACWSKYTFPIAITGFAMARGVVYLRDADNLYTCTEDNKTDDGGLIDVEVQMAFQNAKSPGVEKQFYGCDAIFDGTADLSFLYDPRDPTKETIPQEVTGPTAPGQVVPMEVVGASIAPIIRHSLDEPFELDSLSLYYHSLTAQN